MKEYQSLVGELKTQAAALENIRGTGAVETNFAKEEEQAIRKYALINPSLR